jgi:prepilin-type N-terminal cleavage/methylation domain-containing protein
MRNNESGFTLIELMVATAMVTIVVGVIYAAYNIQTKIYTEQDKTAEMQQNIRSGMWYLQREARMAGYNPENIEHNSCSAGSVTLAAPGIHTAELDSFGFSMDFRGDDITDKEGDGDCGDPGENVTYSINVGNLARAAPSNRNPIAENITEIDFLYLLEDSHGIKTLSRDPGNLNDIVAVQVSMLARSKTEDRAAKTTSTFTLPVPTWGTPNPVNAKTWPKPNDSYRYRLLATTINCRNMGLLK